MLYIYMLHIRASELLYQNGTCSPVFKTERKKVSFSSLKGKTIAIAEMFGEKDSTRTAWLQRECWEELEGRSAAAAASLLAHSLFCGCRSLVGKARLVLLGLRSSSIYFHSKFTASCLALSRC